jgi:Transposase IS66 family
MICPSGSSSGWERRSISPEPARTSRPRPWREKSESWKNSSKPFWRAPTGCDLAGELQAKIGRARGQLLTFCDFPGEVDVTNNTSERKLRPCVIQRKVTNG